MLADVTVWYARYAIEDRVHCPLNYVTKQLFICRRQAKAFLFGGCLQTDEC